MARQDYPKNISAFICLGAYGAALIAAAAVVLVVKDYNDIAAAFCADVAATVVIFLFSAGLDNSSMYDPYWSVAPLPIALYWALDHGTGSFSIRAVAVIILVALWGSRLTYNWYRQWK